ncbi:hypothetical protein [Streptomyces sp. NPDC058657]|uniref:hypothetical protein n=1 Tax=unclassified Streptomyces TaxID=2593676 RepID=UPI00365C7675
MFLHAIPPSRAFTKVPNALFLRTTLDIEARFLLAYLGGLKPAEQHAPLQVLATKLGMKGTVFKRVKKQLIQHGYVYDHRAQGAKGLWFTEQWVSTVPLTKGEFHALRSEQASPGVRYPTVGEPGGPSVGRSTGTSQTNSNNTSPTRPPQDPAGMAETAGAAAPTARGASTPQGASGGADPEPHFALAERILRDLRTVRGDLVLSFRNIRYLAGTVAEQLQQGLPAWEIHHALTHALPGDPILNAAGFVTHRLRKNVPDPAGLAASADGAGGQSAVAPAPEPAPAPVRRAIVECRGPGRPGEHVFRPVAEETFCEPCRRAHPRLAAFAEQEHGGHWAPLSSPSATEPPF